LGFESTNLSELALPTGSSGGRAWFDEFVARIGHYRERRDYPALRGPSYLSVHLRFGTLSIRELIRAARRARGEGPQVWLSELIWREFYFMILYHHPHVVTHAFRPAFDRIGFENRRDLFEAWCEARTGYPLVDAAMRQINQTGYMHNRLRMVTASFLVKDLHVDWRWGERYFARKLNDYDLAANNGGWQWAASTGCDAQPYFRIFNPETQSRKFDPQGRFIRLFVPELGPVSDRFIHAPWTMSATEQAKVRVKIGQDYPAPIVDHAQARRAALKMYAAASQSS
jgi:deoxyribodipyrimidine photo-lyase